MSVLPPPEAWRRNGPSHGACGRVPPAKPARYARTAAQIRHPLADAESAMRELPLGKLHAAGTGAQSADASRKSSRWYKGLPDAVDLVCLPTGLPLPPFPSASDLGIIVTTGRATGKETSNALPR